MQVLNQDDHKLCSESVEVYNCKILVDDSGSLSSVTLRAEYWFAFQFWYSELCVENWWGGCRQYCVVNFCSLAVLVGGWGVVGWGQKSYLGPAEIASFSSQDYSWSCKHDTSWHVVLTGNFYVLYLWALAVSDICPVEILKNFGLSLSTITKPHR